MNLNLKFRKNGNEIKTSIKSRINQLEKRLEKRNISLNEFMKDSKRLRSYLVRSTEQKWMHGREAVVLYGKEDISSEEKEEISQLCRRILKSNKKFIA